MQIGIIGAGSIGSTAAKLFGQVGHHVAISNSRGLESLTSLVAELGPNVQAMTSDDAARFGEVILVAIPFGRYQSFPADALAGKIVIDANNYYPERDGQFPELDNGITTSSELLAAHLPKARVIKAFNTLYYKELATLGDTSLPSDDKVAIFVAGDDPDAKSIVCGLIEQIGFGPVDTGALAEGGRRQQPGTSVYAKKMTVSEARETLGDLK